MDTEISGLLDKLPLAEATWLLWNKVLPDQSLNAFYDAHRGPCYERSFTFANLVYLVNDVLCQHGGRAQQTLERHADTEHCPASEQAFYGKLRRMPVALSEAFLATGSDLLRPWLSRRPYAEVPPSLRDFRVNVLDGKALKNAAKRLKPVRCCAGRGLGGKALVAMELSTGLLIGMTADADGHANEAKLVPKLLPTIRDRLPGLNLWMADQQFGDLAQVRRCTEQGDHCVLRLHPKSRFSPDTQQPVRRGVDRNDRAWIDEIGELHSTRQGTMTMRRITLQRGDDKPLQIITDLLDTQRYPANDLLELYRQRWGIEQVFQKVSEVFQLRHLIGSSPQAIIFQGALCMMLYNLLQVVRALLAETQDRPASTVSTFNVLYDLKGQLNTLHYLVGPDRLLEALRERAAAIKDLRTYLRSRLRQAWTDRWIKDPPKKRHTKPHKHKRGTGGHFSIHRALVENNRTNHV
jgi:DDE family transposase